ncbi:hypothetical protein D3C79_857340 [compost metagenome]
MPEPDPRTATDCLRRPLLVAPPSPEKLPYSSMPTPSQPPAKPLTPGLKPYPRGPPKAPGWGVTLASESTTAMPSAPLPPWAYWSNSMVTRLLAAGKSR